MSAAQTAAWAEESDVVKDDDFRAFWASRQAEVAPETKRILGVDVVVPTDIPLRVEVLSAKLQDSQDVNDLRPLLVDIFGTDHLDAWIAGGMTVHMAKVILAWGVANGSGTPCTFERAVELAAEMEGVEGKALPAANRATRRASSTTVKSVSTGRSSSRTSAASTTSRRRRSAG